MKILNHQLKQSGEKEESKKFGGLYNWEQNRIKWDTDH